MSVIAKVSHDEKLGAYNIKFEYGRWDWNQVEGLVAMIKMTIPASDRLYEPSSKEWTISAKYWIWLEDLFKKANLDIREEKIVNPEDFFYNQGTATPIVESKDSLAQKLVAMLGITAQDLQDAGLLKKAYRRKALELHPDRNNGDGAMMSELNSIWSQYNA